MCNEVIYCTNKCRTNDQTYHYQTCSQAFDSEDDEDFTQLSVDLTPQTGLHNIGNSCYMNSIVQALVSLDGIRSFFSTN
jgi:ubiquitin C-terminal hydrolase